MLPVRPSARAGLLVLLGQPLHGTPLPKMFCAMRYGRGVWCGGTCVAFPCCFQHHRCVGLVDPVPLPGSMSLPAGPPHETVASGGDFKEPSAPAPQQVWVDNKLQLQSPSAATTTHDTPQSQSADMHAHQGAHADPMTQSSAQMNPYELASLVQPSCASGAGRS